MEEESGKKVQGYYIDMLAGACKEILIVKTGLTSSVGTISFSSEYFNAPGTVAWAW